jgi:hypothetical protein
MCFLMLVVYDHTVDDYMSTVITDDYDAALAFCERTPRRNDFVLHVDLYEFVDYTAVELRELLGAAQ